MDEGFVDDGRDSGAGEAGTGARTQWPPREPGQERLQPAQPAEGGRQQHHNQQYQHQQYNRPSPYAVADPEVCAYVCVCVCVCTRIRPSLCQGSLLWGPARLGSTAEFMSCALHSSRM